MGAIFVLQIQVGNEKKKKLVAVVKTYCSIFKRETSFVFKTGSNRLNERSTEMAPDSISTAERGKE